MEERNRLEAEKKVMAKALAAEIVGLEGKNWELCSKLRDIDSYLLQYYEKKSKRRDRGEK